MAVEGRPNESGDVEKMSVGGRARDIDSKESREKIVLRVSKRGRITVSLYERRTIRRTSRAWEAGISLLEEEGSAPQKSRAVSEGIKGPWPVNSRSRGRKTACIYGRIEVKVKSHISTRRGMRRSSGVRRNAWSSEPNPVERRSRRSSTIMFGARF